MKKVLFSLLIFSAALFIGTEASAQRLKEWTWDTYNTKFSVPSDFQVTKNNASEFTATNKRISLSIFPRKNENLSYRAMENAIVRWARSSNVQYSGSPEYMEDLNGYWGCYIDGTAQGYPTSVLLLVDPDYPDTSLYIWLSYQQNELDTAVEMLRSFTLN